MLPEVLLQLHHDLMQRAMVAEQAEAAERAARVAAEARVAELEAVAAAQQDR